MRWKQGTAASDASLLWGSKQAPGGLDDFLQAGGDFEIAERIRREPPEIVEFLIQDRLAEGPAPASFD